MAIHAIVTSESFNTQPREGGCLEQAKAQVDGVQFQHTAARRRLLYIKRIVHTADLVSTHSRAKAAA